MFAPPSNQIIIALPRNPTLTEFLFQSAACLFGGIVLHLRSKACPGLELNSDGFIRYTVFIFLSEVKDTSMCLHFIGD